MVTKEILYDFFALPKLFNRLNIYKSFFYIRNYGFRLFLQNVRRKIANDNHFPIIGIKHEKSYCKWIKKNEPRLKELESQKKKRFQNEPRISIIVSTFNTSKQFLLEMIESVINQTYSNWELCLADGASKAPYIRKTLETYAKKITELKLSFYQKTKV